jgi:hypothetical protein
MAAGPRGVLVARPAVVGRKEEVVTIQLLQTEALPALDKVLGLATLSPARSMAAGRLGVLVARPAAVGRKQEVVTIHLLQMGEEAALC